MLICIHNLEAHGPENHFYSIIKDTFLYKHLQFLETCEDVT
jgi:hypothetical protein